MTFVVINSLLCKNDEPALSPYFLMTPFLEKLGWDEHFAAQWPEFEKRGWTVGRLIRETKINFTALLDDGDELDVIVTGKLWHDAVSDADLPAVGDWVAIDTTGGEQEDPVIRKVLERKSRFSRKMPGKSSDEQVVCANVDYVVVVTDPGPDFNARRLERYFMLIEKTGCVPVVVINKRDIVEAADLQKAVEIVKTLSNQVQVHTMSALTDDALEILSPYLTHQKTVALVGSSGVGKSTILNRILREDWQETGDVNNLTGKGRHTTTARELVLLDEGGLLVDNPGMREIQMWTDEDTLRESFQDIESISQECKFHDCKHQGDKGCAIQAAVNSGKLDEERYQSYLNLEDEVAELNYRRKKRKMTTERWSKRKSRVKARNLEDRIQLEKDERGEV